MQLPTRRAARARLRHHLGVLFPRSVRPKLVVALLGSVAVSFVETASILLLLPLMQLLGGADPGSGVLGAISRFLGDPPTGRLVVLLVAGVLGGFIIKDVFTMAFRWWVLGFLARQQVRTAARLLSYFLHAPYTMHLRRGMADMMRVVADSVGQFYGRTVAGFISLITEALTILTILVALVWTMPLMTLGLVAYFGLSGYIFLRVIKPRAEAAATRQLEAGKAAFEAAIHSFGGIEEIQIRHAQAHFAGRYARASLTGSMAGRVSSFLSELPKYLMEILFVVGLGLIILASRGDNGGGLFATVAVLAAAAFRVLPSMTRIITALATIRSGEPSRRMLMAELLDEADMGPAAIRAAEPGRLNFTRDIVFEEVAYQFPDGDQPVLRGVSFTIPAGSSVAFVGGSGAGKTTVARLLLGLLTPTSGRILVDGVDVTTCMSEWQNGLAFVPQDVFHMDLPLSENIAFDQPPDEIDRPALERAVAQAQLSDFVASLPDGLDSRVGDRAVRLSGGQRQRIGIARALYRDPQLLLLDEATSALDNETERKITDTIAALHGQLTIVIIAHRLSTVRHVDRIILLSDGRVGDQGTFAELTARSSEFARFVQLGQLEVVDPEVSPS
jgi:ABC-type multidrug transport system fused ATPase/permease subunit